MRTMIAAIATTLFLASAASACPFGGHGTAEEETVVKKPVVVGS